MIYYYYKYISSRYTLPFVLVLYLHAMILLYGSLFMFSINGYFGVLGMLIVLVYAYLISKLKLIKIRNTEYLEVKGVFKKEDIKRETVKRVGSIAASLYYVEAYQGQRYYFLPRISLNPFRLLSMKQEELRDEMFTRIRDQFPYNSEGE